MKREGFNKYGIPEKEVAAVIRRDKKCVYCRIRMKKRVGSAGSQGTSKTIEHLNNAGPFNKGRNIAICCGRCNSSRSNKRLRKWFESPYCLKRGINEKTVALIVKKYIDRFEKLKKRNKR